MYVVEICGDEVVVVAVVVVVVVVVCSFEIFWNVLRHWHVDVKTVWVVLTSLPAAPALRLARDRSPWWTANRVWWNSEILSTNPRTSPCRLIKGFECRILLNYSTWGIVLWYDLNWFDTVCIDSILLWTVPTTRPLLLNVMPCCYTLWQLQQTCPMRRRGATVAPVQVDNPCFMVPMRTQRRQWREKE